MGYVAKWNEGTWTVVGQPFDKVNLFAMTVSATQSALFFGSSLAAGVFRYRVESIERSATTKADR